MLEVSEEGEEIKPKATKEELDHLYWDRGMTLDEIAKLYDVSERTVRRWMDMYGIERRDRSEAARLAAGEYEMSLEDILDSLDKVEPVKYDPAPVENLSIPIPLKCLEKNRKLDATVTIVMSDLHLGHENHLPDTYWSTVSNLCRVLKGLSWLFNIRRANLVLNGDIVSGIGVYRGQEFQNIVSRGHWQVFVAEMVIKKTLEMIRKYLEIHRIYLVKGTHEQRENNYMLYLRKIFDPLAVYASKSLILNVAEPIGNYNVLFTHGRGRSSYYPVSYEQVRNIWKALRQLDVPIERVILGHTHWLTQEIDFEGILVSVTGGFQKWQLTVPQRPSGMLVILYCDGESVIIPVRPDPEIAKAELKDPSLEYKCMRYYAELLSEHMRGEPGN